MITVTEMERMQICKDLNELIEVLDRNQFDGFKKIVDIYYREIVSTRKEAPTIFPISKKITLQVITGGSPRLSS